MGYLAAVRSDRWQVVSVDTLTLRNYCQCGTGSRVRKEAALIVVLLWDLQIVLCPAEEKYFSSRDSLEPSGRAWGSSSVGTLAGEPSVVRCCLVGEIVLTEYMSSPS